MFIAHLTAGNFTRGSFDRKKRGVSDLCDFFNENKSTIMILPIGINTTITQIRNRRRVKKYLMLEYVVGWVLKLFMYISK